MTLQISSWHYKYPVDTLQISSWHYKYPVDTLIWCGNSNFSAILLVNALLSQIYIQYYITEIQCFHTDSQIQTEVKTAKTYDNFTLYGCRYSGFILHHNPVMQGYSVP